jgi:S-formylglutathione hydrolase
MTAAISLETLSTHACFGGTQGYYRHASTACAASMRFGVFVPPQAAQGPVPVLYWLAGLTCTEETFAIKAGAQRACPAAGRRLLTPDTSPRGTGLPGADDRWDLGHGAGFYLDATEAPWSARFLMERYLLTELLPAVGALGADLDRVGITGHSMGGHGALTLALRHPGRFRSVSAFAPICAPSQCPWGEQAFGAYLGPDRAEWAAHDATALIAAGRRCPPLLVDQGEADQFLEAQLHPHLLEAACAAAGQPLTLRRHPGYDHGYWFVQSVVADHVAHHAALLG